MVKFSLLWAVVTAAALSTVANAQSSNSPPDNIVSTLETALTKVNTNSTVWSSNLFTIYEGAAFSSVSGVPGQSAIGNDLGIIVPVLKLGANENLAVDSATRFETLFGNVAHQQFGALAQYNYYNVKLAAGLAGRYRLPDGRLLAVPCIEIDDQITGPMAAIVRYSFPIERKPGAGELLVGVSFPFGKK